MCEMRFCFCGFTIVGGGGGGGGRLRWAAGVYRWKGGSGPQVGLVRRVTCSLRIHSHHNSGTALGPGRAIDTVLRFAAMADVSLLFFGGATCGVGCR